MFTSKLCVEVDPVDFKFLVVQVAATVLVICEERSTDIEVNQAPDQSSHLYDRIAIRLSTYVSWAAHGYINSLQAMVELLYDFVQLHLDHDFLHPSLLDLGDRRIITDALLPTRTGGLVT